MVSVLACIDTERVGDYVSSLSGIGFAVVSSEGVLLKNLRLWIRFDEKLEEKGGDVARRTMEEFWDKHPTIWKEMIENGKEKELQIKTFVEEWDKLEETYGKIELVCDNPEFDFGSLNDLVFQYCGRKPLRYGKKTGYRSITDLGEVAWFLGVNDIVQTQASKIVEHTHRPDEDAEFNIISHLIMNNARNKILNECGPAIKRILEEIAEETVSQIKKKRTEGKQREDKK